METRTIDADLPRAKARRGKQIRIAHDVWCWFATFLLIVALALPQRVSAQDANAPPFLSKEQLDQLLAPIALYPDDLLSNIFMASTYPLEVVEAARWRKDPKNAKLKGDALAKALETQDWDPSVKALTQVPEVLEMMSEKLDWTQKLGDAFLAQQDDVMNEVQFLRQKADEAGSLKSNKQQKVTKQANYIVIEPASPDIVYVPVYQPTVVYGPWWYPNYPPYYWNYGYPASAFVSGFFWGAGFAVANSLWGWGRCDWRNHNIDINVNRYNRINVNRTQITSNTWRHDPKHRGPVPYRDKQSREKYGKLNDQRRDAREQFRGREPGKVGGIDRDNIKGGVNRDKMKDRVGGSPGDRAKDAIKSPGGNVKDRAAAGKVKNIKKQTPSPKKGGSRPTPRKSFGAFDVKPGKTVRANSNRGAASRRSAAVHRPSGGGRGGGGRRGGGRRR